MIGMKVNLTPPHTPFSTRENFFPLTLHTPCVHEQLPRLARLPLPNDASAFKVVWPGGAAGDAELVAAAARAGDRVARDGSVPAKCALRAATVGCCDLKP
jgi:hypothetical protein